MTEIYTNKYQLLVEKIHALCQFSQEGTLVYANEKMCALMDLPLEILLGKHWQELFVYQEYREEADFNPLQQAEGWQTDLQIKYNPALYCRQQLWHLPSFAPNAIGTEMLVSFLHEDISAQKRKERTYQRIEKILKHTSDAVLMIDPQSGKILDSNARVSQLLGYEAEELQAMYFQELEAGTESLQSQEQWASYTQEMANLRQRSITFSARQAKKNFEIIPVEITLKYEEINGEAVVVALIQNISQRIELEEMLENQNKKSHALIENLDDAIFLIDAQGKTRYLSPSCYKQFGYTEKDLLGKDFSRIIDKEDIPFVRKIFSQVTITKGKLFQTTCRIKNKNGSHSWVEIKAKNLLREPAIGAIVINIHNVTNQTLAEERIIRALEREQDLNEALAESESKLKNALDLMHDTQEQLSLLVQQSPIGIQIFDAQGRTLSINKTWTLVTGMHFEQLQDYCILEDKQLEAQGILAYVKKAFQGEAVVLPLIRYTMRTHQGDTREVTVRAYAYPIKKSNQEIKNVVLLYEDIAEQQQAEQKTRSAYQALEAALEKEQHLNTRLAAREDELREINLNLSKSNEELTKINSELDRFVYSASHDLRAPISSVMGLISIAKMTDKLEEIYYYLDLQEKSIKKLDKFIQDILDYSRNARMALHSEQVSFRNMLESVFDQHSYMEYSSKIEKVVHLQQSEKFYSDSSRLTVIFNNLISNAIRYVRRTEAHPFIEVAIEVKEKKAKITVSDNGQGIAPEHLHRVFEMFYRATEKQSGSGLGLYIVKETVEKLGGQIQIHSEVDKGTKIFFEIPSLQ